MMQGWTRRRNIGVWRAAVVIVAGPAVCGVWPVWAEENLAIWCFSTGGAGSMQACTFMS
jgi:hypothetical protein